MKSLQIVMLSMLLLKINCKTKEKQKIEGVDEDPVCFLTHQDCQRIYNKDFFPKFKSTIYQIKKLCGSVCDTDMTSDYQGLYYDQLWKNIDCKAMFENDIFDRKSEFHASLPLRLLPYFLRKEFTYNYKFEIANQYIDNRYRSTNGESEYYNWTMEEIQTFREQFRNGTLIGLYERENIEDITNHLENHMDIKGKHVLVIGTQKPWIEVILLELGAALVTTVEYARINSPHPKLKTMLPTEMSSLFLEGKLPEFEAMVTFSSIEHGGLGGYGEAINPWSDLITIARAWCVLKPKARALVGVPTGPDRVEFNAHKVYGPIMYSHLFANWCQIHKGPQLRPWNINHPFREQPVHVIEKISTISEESNCPLQQKQDREEL